MEAIKYLRGLKIKNTNVFFELVWKVHIPRAVCIEVQALNMEHEFSKLINNSMEEVKFDNLHGFTSMDGLVECVSPVKPIIIV